MCSDFSRFIGSKEPRTGSQVIDGYNDIPGRLLMWQIRRVAAADGMGANPDNGELLVAVLAYHEVTVLNVPLLLVEADIAGIECGVKGTVSALDHKETYIFATIINAIEVGPAIRYL
jgi:hypothetical protein